jgi:hypothetical protein
MASRKQEPTLTFTATYPHGDFDERLAVIVANNPLWRNPQLAYS